MLNGVKLATAVQGATELGTELGTKLDRHAAALEHVGDALPQVQQTAREIASDVLVAAVILGSCVLLAALVTRWG